MKDNQNSQVADKKKITFEFCPHLVSFVKKQMIKGLPLKKNKKIEALMILIEKKPKRAKKQFRRNVALLFLSLSLSLSVFVLSFPTKQKKKNFTLTTVPPQNQHFIKKNVVTCHPRTLHESKVISRKLRFHPIISIQM